MKTTIEISDPLFEKTKKIAHERKTTMRHIIESALRRYLREKSDTETSYHFKNKPFHGEGVCEGIREGEWETLRAHIYSGRGG